MEFIPGSTGTWSWIVSTVFELFYNDCKVPLSGTFTLNFFIAVDLWKVFVKLKLN